MPTYNPFKNKARASLKAPLRSYTPIAIEQARTLGTEAEVRKEYSRLRSIARKRLERLKKAGFDDTQIYKNNVTNLKPLSELKGEENEEELHRRLAKLARFIHAETSTVTGQRDLIEKSLDTLHENGYTFVTKENFKRFTEFMEFSRQYKKGRMRDSERVAEAFNIYEKKGITLDVLKKSFITFVDNAEKAEKIKIPKTGIDSKRLRKMLNI